MCFLGGELLIDVISNFKNFESALYVNSVSMQDLYGDTISE